MICRKKERKRTWSPISVANESQARVITNKGLEYTMHNESIVYFYSMIACGSPVW